MNVYWFEQIDAAVPPGDGWLAASEKLRLSALVIPKRRSDWRLGRWTAKQAVREFVTDRPPAEIEIRAGSTGAPQVWIAGHRQCLTISLSHCRGRACCSVVELPAAMGCDLEWNEPHSSAFIADYFTPAEQDRIAHAAEAGNDALPALLWSAKESALKALGVGLREDTRSVAVQEDSFSSEPCRGDWRRLHVCHEGDDLHGWSRADGQFVRTLIADPPPHAPTTARRSMRGLAAV